MKFITGIAVLLSLCLSCKVQTSDQKREKIKIVCSTTIIRDCIQQIVGDSIEVVSLMGPGIDPHSYKARPLDIALLRSATVVVYNGLHLEGKMAGIFEKMGKTRSVFAVSGSIPREQLIVTDPSAGTTDPHIWFDPELWCTGLKGVVANLGEKYPDRKNDFQKSFMELRSGLKKLQKDLADSLATIPFDQRVLITSHDAFHYFGRAFDVNVKALQGISTTQEPGVKDVVSLVNFIVDHKIRALFVEHSVSPKAIRSVVESAERKGWKIKIGGTLYSDALGDERSNGSTYQNMLISNVMTLVKGLKDE